MKTICGTEEQFISSDYSSINKATVTCSVPEGSILGLFLCLLYVDDLHHASKLLNAITFMKKANVFFSHSDSNALLEKINQELINITSLSNANKLSLKVKEVKYSSFKKLSKNI